MTLAEWLPQAEAKLREAGIESARLESRIFAAEALDKPLPYVLAHGEVEAPLLAERWLQRRLTREPLAHILGWREFFGRRFSIRPSVLIPRQETETLVEEALKRLKPGDSVLDVGTGSGCIAITLKLEQPDILVTAIDISPEALEVARGNARAHHGKFEEDLSAGDSDQFIKFLESDLFSALPDRKFDLIVSNPPYIAEGEELMPEVGIYEPRTALFSGPSGLELYERLACEAAQHLAPNGVLLVEVGHNQANPVVHLFEGRSWKCEEVVKDLSGIERVVILSPVR